MEKWKGSTAAKILAWIVLSASALCFIFSAAGTVFMIEEGIYDNTKDETRKKSFEQVSYEYGLSAIDDLRRERTESTDTSPYFKYGIIKAESLDGIDLNDEKSYAVRNFSDKISKDDVYTNSVELSDEDQIVYTNRSFLTGGGVELMYSGDDSYTSVYADRICYDEARGIFVYLAGNEYYPVQQIEVESDEAGEMIFTYDQEKEMYLNEQAAKAVLDREYVTFDMFDGTTLDVNNWGMLLLDGVREISMDEIDRIDSSDKNADIAYTANKDYYLDSNYTLWINIGQEEPKITYQMVVLLPQNVETGWSSSDWYVQANTLVDFVYSVRYAVLVVMFISFLIGAAAFVFLMSAAGYRKGTDAIVTTVWDRLWLDVFAVLIVFAEVFIFYVTFMFLANIDITYLPVSLLIFSIAFLCMGWLLLLFLLSFSVRVKLGKWWRNTLCYRICNKIMKFFRMISDNIGFLWKVIAVMLLLAFFEGIAVLIFLNSSAAFWLWLLEKLILYPWILGYCVQINQLKTGTGEIAGGEPGYQINTKRMTGIFREQGEQINHISDGMTHAIEERMKSERFKTELITNVSHDIKTPLTSIINYVDLLEKEELHNETAQEYLEVLERQSSRLKKLIEDLIEASKASTGNLPVHLERLEAGIFMTQTVGEFEEKTKAAGLDLVIEKPETPVYIMADSRHFWRVIDNLMNNICKYAQNGTRVYINLEVKEAQVSITFRNTSKYPLNISSEELMERFVRGDSSRNTEGSGLGLSIANSLMELMGGTFHLYVDGDLFKVVLGFAEAKEKKDEI